MYFFSLVSYATWDSAASVTDILRRKDVWRQNVSAGQVEGRVYRDASAI